MRIEWIETYLKSAEKLIMEGEVERGIHILSNLLYEEPGYSPLHNHIGWAHLYYSGNMEQAEIHLKAAIALHPESAPPYLHAGQLYLRKGQYSAAIEILHAGLSRAEANKVALYEGIGQAYEMRHEYKKAIAAYKNAALCSLATFEINNLAQGIRRCRRKRWMNVLNL